MQKYPIYSIFVALMIIVATTAIFSDNKLEIQKKSHLDNIQNSISHSCYPNRGVLQQGSHIDDPVTILNDSSMLAFCVDKKKNVVKTFLVKN